MSDTRSVRLSVREHCEFMFNAGGIIFREHGHPGAGTDAIAAAAGVSRAYVARTFGSKEALIAAAASQAPDRIAEVFRDATSA